MADKNGNSLNHDIQEIFLPIWQDGIITRNWGGSLFLIASTHKSDDMPYYGTTEGWAGNRCRPELITKFFPNGNAPTGNMDAMITAAGDDRAMFFSIDRTLSIDDESMFVNGFSCVKYSNVRADGAPSNDSQHTDTDVPFMRLAEAYLIFAEANIRQHGGATSEATEAINTLRRRAHARTETSYTLNDIFNEWSKEFYFEGRRRSDLIRFNRYGGNTDYTWQWEGGVKDGTRFGRHSNCVSILINDMNSNPNCTLNQRY